MALFKNMAITYQGMALFAKAQAGKEIHFTKMQVGSGQIGTQNPDALIALIDPKLDIPITSITPNSKLKSATIIGNITNKDVKEALYICEMGLFAKDPDLGEILYGYVSCGQYGDYYAPESQGPYNWQYQISVSVGNAANVTAELSELNWDYSLMTSITDFIHLSGSNQKEINKSIDNKFKEVVSSLDDLKTDIGDKTKLKTTDKTNLVNAVNELFTNANNGKQNWVDVVGSPLVSTDTFSTLKDKTQTLKNTLASSLTVKEQNSSGTESLQNLINKVGNIKVGKRFIEGTQLVKLSYTQVYNLNTDFTMNTILLHFNDRTSNTKLNFIFSPIFSEAEWGNVNTSPEIYITATYPKNSTNMTNDIRMSLTITNNQISIYCTATMDCDLKYSIFE